MYIVVTTFKFFKLIPVGIYILRQVKIYKLTSPEILSKKDIYIDSVTIFLKLVCTIFSLSYLDEEKINLHRHSKM